MAVSDIKVNPTNVYWNGALLGSTSGGVEISTEVQSTDIIVDQEGTSPADAYFTDRKSVV